MTDEQRELEELIASTLYNVSLELLIREHYMVVKNLATAILQHYVRRDRVKPLSFNLKCGCFITTYLDSLNRINAGLTCCKKHELPYAKAEDFYLSISPDVIVEGGK